MKIEGEKIMKRSLVLLAMLALCGVACPDYKVPDDGEFAMGDGQDFAILYNSTNDRLEIQDIDNEVVLDLERSTQPGDNPGTLTVTADLVAGGDLLAGDDLDVTDDAQIDGDLTVTGTTSLDSTLYMNDDVRLVGQFVTGISWGDETTERPLTVDAYGTAPQAIAITSVETTEPTGGSIGIGISGIVGYNAYGLRIGTNGVQGSNEEYAIQVLDQSPNYFEGDTTFGQDVILGNELTDDVTIAGTLHASGHAELGSSLDVTGVCAFDSDLYVGGDVYVNSGVVISDAGIFAVGSMPSGVTLDTEWDTRDEVEAVWSGTTTIWCDDNDGTGSGLDADTLDGNEASAFEVVDADIARVDEAETITGGWTIDGNLTFADEGDAVVLPSGSGDITLEASDAPGFPITIISGGNGLMVTDGSDAILFAAAAGNSLLQGSGNATFQFSSVSADTTVTIENDDGTYEANLDVEGDADVGGDLTVTGAFLPRQVTDAGPMTATAGTTGEIVFNTSDSKFYGCTAGGTPATWAALH